MTALKGEYVKSVRQRFGLDVESWARLLGVSSSTIYRWEASVVCNIDRHQHSLIVLLVKLPKQNLAALMTAEPPLKVLWRILGQVYGTKGK